MSLRAYTADIWFNLHKSGLVTIGGSRVRASCVNLYKSGLVTIGGSRVRASCVNLESLANSLATLDDKVIDLFFAEVRKVSAQDKIEEQSK